MENMQQQSDRVMTWRKRAALDAHIRLRYKSAASNCWGNERALCECCGNFVATLTKNPVVLHAACGCNFVTQQFQKERVLDVYKQMDVYDSCDLFIQKVLPVGKGDLLCEDVIGVVLSYIL